MYAPRIARPRNDRWLFVASVEGDITAGLPKGSRGTAGARLIRGASDTPPPNRTACPAPDVGEEAQCTGVNFVLTHDIMIDIGLGNDRAFMLPALDLVQARVLESNRPL